jgi:hypothetical protein
MEAMCAVRIASGAWMAMRACHFHRHLDIAEIDMASAVPP